VLPKNVDTARGRYLQSLIAAASTEEMMSWPEINEADYSAIGKLFVMYSYIDFNFRRMIEDYDDAGLLPPPWKARSKKLNITSVEDAVRGMLSWPNNALGALNRITELRSLRNLFAHFAVSRFPNDDAFFFMGKSASDYKQIFGGEADPALMLTAALDANALHGKSERSTGFADLARGSNVRAGYSAGKERADSAIKPSARVEPSRK
jgi:hypothetical protein